MNGASQVDARWMTISDYRWCRVLAAVEAAFPPRPGHVRRGIAPADLVAAYEQLHMRAPR